MPQIGGVHFLIDSSFAPKSGASNDPARPYVVDNNDYTAIAKLMAAIQALFDPSTPTGKVLASLSGTIYITKADWKLNDPNNAAYIGKRAIDQHPDILKKPLADLSFVDIIPEVKSQVVTDANGNPVLDAQGNPVTATVVDPGVTGVAYDPKSATGIMDLGSSNIDPQHNLFSFYTNSGGTAYATLDRVIFHELMHAVSADLNKPEWTYPNVTSVAVNDRYYKASELVAIDLENLAYIRNPGITDSAIRSSHDNPSNASSKGPSRSSDPTKSFRGADVVYASGGVLEAQVAGEKLFKKYKEGVFSVRLDSTTKYYSNYVTMEAQGQIMTAAGSATDLTQRVLDGSATSVGFSTVVQQDNLRLRELKELVNATLNKPGVSLAGLDNLKQIDPSKVAYAAGISSAITGAEAMWTGPREVAASGTGSGKDAPELYLAASGSTSTLLIGASGAHQLNVDFRDRTDYLVGASGDDMLIVGTGSQHGHANIAIGGDGQDTLIGNLADDDLRGGNGDDIILGSAGNDKIDGGAGSDTYVLAAGAGNQVIDIAKQTVTGGKSVATVQNVETFVGNDSLTTFIGDGTGKVFIAGSGGGDFTLKANDVAIGDPNSSASNVYHVTSTDLGKIKILNFNKNDKIYVDGKLLSNYIVTTHVSESSIYDISGTNRDILANTSGLQTTISGSLGGSINSLTYSSPSQLGQVGDSAGEYHSGQGTAKTLVELIPSSDQPNSVVVFHFSTLQADGSTQPGLDLVVEGYQDGYGGIRVRSDRLSLALQGGQVQDFGNYEWSGSVIADNRGYYTDGSGRFTYADGGLISPYSDLWRQLTGDIAQSSSELLSDGTVTSAAVTNTALAFNEPTTADYGGSAAPLAYSIGDEYPISSDADLTLSGDAGANLLDPQGAYDQVVGNGGGDTFVYGLGYGVVWIDEQDTATQPANVLQLGPGITPDTTLVLGDASGDLVLDFGGGDAVVVKGALLAPDAAQTTFGVQSVVFDDGTTWTYDDLVSRASTASQDNLAPAGDWRPNVLDSNGVASELIGNGGGDTFVYNAGDGAVIIDEQDATADPVNLLAFGEGITADMITVSGTEDGDIVLDLGNGDGLLIKGALKGTDANGVTDGIQSFTFADGTAWSYDDVLNLALTPRDGLETLYGDVNYNWIDTQGQVARVVGNGGGDDIFFDVGYGRLVVDEQDTSATPDNWLDFGDQITPDQVIVTADDQGNLILSISATDQVVITGALNSDGATTWGIQGFNFADGTFWTYADVLAKADTASLDNTELFGDRSANVLDSLGIATTIVGAGGGDTFVYNSGYGALTIDEFDDSAAPANVLQLGDGLLIANLTVSGTATGDLVLSFGGSDVITLAEGLDSTAGETYGVQQVVFADGTVLTYADLLAKVGTASATNTATFGDRTANTLDTLGLASSVTGGGGGDTFVYAQGYGPVVIDERDDGEAPANVIQFASGITASDLAVSASDNGDLILSLGGDDVLTIAAALQSLDGITNGVQTLVFADGTVLTYADLLQRVETPSSPGASIFGDTAANVLDTGGIASRVVGNGGGDTFLFNAGYGQVVLDEQDEGSTSGNVLVLGSGLDPANASVTGNSDGNLILDLGAGDSVVIKGALNLIDETGIAWGIEQVLFDDGTVWTYDDLLAKADTAAPSNTVLYGDSAANVLDGAGIAQILVGNGGGDTFVYDTGYGALTIDEEDTSSYAFNPHYS